MYRSRFEKELEELNTNLIRLGGLIEQAIYKSIDALIKQDKDLAADVIAGKKEISSLARIIEGETLKILLRQQPIASDLRVISTALKMVTDMERIGSQAVDICEIVLHLCDEEYKTKLIVIPQMADKTKEMVKGSVDSFVKMDIDLAKRIIEMDEEVDESYFALLLQIPIRSKNMSELVYAVEDDESIRELIKYALINDGHEAVAFESAEKMLKKTESRLPALIILDIMLPQMDGITALKILREKYKNVNIKVIMLTAKNSEINKLTGLDSGADDYITKPFSVLELMARVKAHLRRYAVNIDSDSLIFEGIRLNPKLRSVSVNDQPISLTYKEFEVLYSLMKNAGEIVSREKLLKDIWGFDYMDESRTVDIHVKNIRAKLGTFGECIINVRSVGYSLRSKE